MTASESTDREPSFEQQSLVARGRVVLARLTREAEAARAEARRAELEQVLAEADQFGNTEHLRRWLAEYEPGAGPATGAFSQALLSMPSELRSPAANPSKGLSDRAVSDREALQNAAPIAAAPTAVASAFHSAPEVGSTTQVVTPAALPSTAAGAGWEQFLPQARERLAAHARELGRARSAASAAPSTAAPSTAAPSTAALTTAAPATTSVDADAVKPLPIDAGKSSKSDGKENDQLSPAKLTRAESKAGSVAKAAELTEKKSVAAKPEAAKTIASQPDALKPVALKLSNKVQQSSAQTKDAAKEAAKGKAIAAIAKPLTEEELQKQQEQHAKQLRVSRLRGLSASVILHIALVLLLAFITLKMPAPPASLAFEAASSTSTETFEISQPVEASAAEVTESTELPELPTDISQTFDSLSTELPTQLAINPVSVASAASVSSAVAAARMASSISGAVASGASFFGAESSGNCFCYVVDSSGSMNGGAWEAAKAELSRSLDSLDDGQRFYIIFFNKQLDLLPAPGETEPAPNPMYANKENIQHAKRWLDTVRISGGGPPNSALEAAIELEPDAIYLLTDGVTSVDVCGHLQKVNRISDFINGEQVRVPIHAIAYYSLKGETLMRKVAAENNGQFIYVPDPGKKK